ncbi:MAG: T9SS type A sorting domain-containing protein [Chitinophagales bacterium]
MKKIYLLLALLPVCVISKAQTWAQDVAPILYANCTACHHSGGIAPFSLLTYADAYQHSGSIDYDVTAKTMPPWPPDENYKAYVHQRVLSTTEINTIHNWVLAGAPQGNVTLAPAQPTYSNGSKLGTVDLSVKIPTYTVSGTGDVYRNFPIASGLLQGKYITAVEVIPGNNEIVHHVLIFQDSTNVPAQLDANDAGPGYTNAGGTGSLASKLIAGYTPGASPYYTPVGTGFRLPAGTNIVVQVHYPAGSQGLVDSTRINFKLSSGPLREITVWPLLNHLQNISPSSINIPANSTKTYTEAYSVGSGNWTFLSAFPHMHLIGRTIKSWANTTVPNDTIRFLDVPDWNFHWQDTYVFPNAVKVPANSTLRATAFYDNTTNNPDNPNSPPQTVHAGEATTDEMMMVFFGFMPYQSGDENLIIDRRVIAQGATTFCNGQSVVLETIEGTGYAYQWYRNGTLINGATAYNYTATQAGNYHVSITLGPNNTLSDTVAVNIATAPSGTISATGSSTLCPNTSITLNAAAGTGYTYQWLNNNVPISGATSLSYAASAAGSYTVQVYNGCYATSSAIVVTTVNAPSATVSTSGSTTFCQGNSVTLSAPAGLSYVWSSGSSNQSITITQAGTYKVTVTDANNCTAVSSNTVVTVNSLPSAAISNSGATTFCQGQSVTLSAPAGLSYNWSNNATAQSIVVTQAGTYTVTVTNANNCSAASSPTVVTVNPLPSATINAGGATSFCPGGSVQLTSAGASSYHWSNSATTQSITVSQSGSYTLTITDANNCSNTASQTVTVFTAPDATVTTNKPTTICPGDSVTLTAPAGLTYSWSNNATTQNITVNQNGNFTVTVTDANSCTAVSSLTTVTVSNNATAGITPSGATTFCDGQNVSLDASGGSSYLWSNGATTPSITVNATGNYTVTVTVSSNCTAVSNPVTVTVNPNPASPQFTYSANPPYCTGQSVDISAPAGYSYQWSDNSTGQGLTFVTNGSYSLTITDQNNCSASSSGSINFNPLPTVSLSGNADTLCSTNIDVQLMGGNPSGGNYSGNGVSAGNFSPQTAGIGLQTISYTYTDNNGCANSASETIEVVLCTNVTELSNTGFTVYPNPADNEVTIRLSAVQETELQLINTLGEIVANEKGKANEFRINVASLSQGLYLVQLTPTTTKQRMQGRLIVAH